MIEKAAAAPPAEMTEGKGGPEKITSGRLKIKYFDKKRSLSEDYQKTGMLFAYATAPDERGEQKACHQFVRCRDYLHDTVRTQLTKERTEVYGFRFDVEENPPVDLTTMRMLVSKEALKGIGNGVEKFREIMKSSLELLNHFEIEAGLPKSEMEEVDAYGSGKECVFLFTSPRQWLSSPFLISMYTFVIRLGDKRIKFTDHASLLKALEELSKQPYTGSDRDIGYLKAIWNRLPEVLKRREELFKYKDGFHDMFFDGHRIDTFHNQCGIVSLFKYCTPNKELNERMRKEEEKK